MFVPRVTLISRGEVAHPGAVRVPPTTRAMPRITSGAAYRRLREMFIAVPFRSGLGRSLDRHGRRTPKRTAFARSRRNMSSDRR